VVVVEVVGGVGGRDWVIVGREQKGRRGGGGNNVWGKWRSSEVRVSAGEMGELSSLL